MLYSRASGVAFAHYPKTGGSSLQHWFRRAFPDARLLAPDNPHLPVHAALGIIAADEKSGPRRSWFPWRTCTRLPAPRLVVGVLRDPFAVLVSLFEYWRDFPFTVEPEAEFIRAARGGSFIDFVRLAVVDGQLPTYEWFFDAGGPAWPRTRLLDFQSLEANLPALARELGLRRPPPLEHRNSHRGTRDLPAYRAAAGELMDQVHAYFSWYYTHGAGIVARPWSGRAA